MWLELFIIFATLICWAITDTRKPRNFPPGPAWLPLLGNLLYVKKLVDESGFHHIAWSRLAEQYGSVVGLKLGTTPPIVLVSGHKAVQEVLSREEFDGRPDNFMFKFRTMGERRGVIFTDGTEWKEQRRFLLRNLRDFGFGKRNMETLILDEAQLCVNKLRIQGELNKTNGVAMSQAFTVPVLNSLWTLIAGIRFDDDHPTLVSFINLNNEVLRQSDASGGLLNNLPDVRHFAPKATGFTTFSIVTTQMWTFFSEFVWEHKQTISDSYSRDLIDVYLKDIASEKDKSKDFSEMQLVAVIKDLFGAGSETSSNTLSYVVLHMVLNPAVQAKAQAEVDKVVGRDRAPSLADRNNLPYVNAVLMEVQRMSNIAPMTIPHRAMRDATLDGYLVPHGATLLVSIWSLHMDEQYWGDPHNFRPERFLDKDGGLATTDVPLMPFGAGRRRCLGENMAKDTLFIFFTLMLQQVTFSVPPDTKPPSPLGINGFTLSTGPFNAVITARV